MAADLSTKAFLYLEAFEIYSKHPFMVMILHIIQTLGCSASSSLESQAVLRYLVDD